MRAAMCVVVRDLIVYGVLTDMMKGPARGLRDVLELRRGRPPLRPRARGHARGAAEARPAVRADRARPPLRRRGRTRSSSSPITGRRRGRRSSSATATAWTSSSSGTRARAASARCVGGDEKNAMVGHAADEATGRKGRGGEEGRLGARRRRARLGQPRPRLPDGGARPADARGDRASGTRSCCRRCRAPAHRLGARAVRASTAPSRSGADGANYLDEDRVDGEDPLARFSPTRAAAPAAHGRLRARAGRLVGSFYDPALDEGCAFEELISFHGGLGGSQTRPFLLHPAQLPAPERADRRRRGRPRACSSAGGRLLQSGPLAADPAPEPASGRSRDRGRMAANGPRSSSRATGRSASTACYRISGRCRRLVARGRAARASRAADVVVFSGWSPTAGRPRPSRCAPRGAGRRSSSSSSRPRGSRPRTRADAAAAARARRSGRRRRLRAAAPRPDAVLLRPALRRARRSTSRSASPAIAPSSAAVARELVRAAALCRCQLRAARAELERRLP